MSDIIYVTINYRLGPFGFMHLQNTEISGNMGFLDQNMALQWIHNNADRFGGDNSRITLSGQRYNRNKQKLLFFLILI